MPTTRKSLALSVVILSCTVLFCSTERVSEPVIEDPPGLPAAATIDILLDNFQEAYSTMSYVEYERLLDDSYLFVFDPRDVNETNGFKELWSRGDDLDSARRMFGGEPDRRNRCTQSIRIMFTPEDPIDSYQGEGWKLIVLSQFDLELEAIQLDNGETWFLRTKGGYEVDLHVRELDTNPPVWKIVQMVDRPPTTVTAVTEDATLGQIKASFR